MGRSPLFFTAVPHQKAPLFWFYRAPSFLGNVLSVSNPVVDGVLTTLNVFKGFTEN
jgi:hypothetical protein